MNYVYAHESPTHGVFYVGKGSGDRMKATGNRSDTWKRYAADGFTPYIISKHDNVAEAFHFEEDAILNFKRMGLCAANVSNGGAGVSVSKRWWGDKISASLKGVKRPSGPDSKSFKDFSAPDELRRLYVDEGLSSVAIGKMFGVTAPTVLSRLLSDGVQPRPVNINARAVICTTTGREYKSITEAAMALGVAPANIRKVIAGKYRQTGGFTFKTKEN